MLTEVRRLCGQRAASPSGVPPHSLRRISAPSSPPPTRKSSEGSGRGRGERDAVIGSPPGKGNADDVRLEGRVTFAWRCGRARLDGRSGVHQPTGLRVRSDSWPGTGGVEPFYVGHAPGPVERTEA